MKILPVVLVAIPLAAYGHDTKHHGDSEPTSADPVSDYVVKLEEMTVIEAGKGEKIHLLRGNEHGFKRLSFILTETAPGGGLRCILTKARRLTFSLPEQCRM